MHVTTDAQYGSSLVTFSSTKMGFDTVRQLSMNWSLWRGYSGCLENVVVVER